MSVEYVTLDEVLVAGAVRGASLVPESSGYLALAISDAISRLPLRVDSGAVAITTEGSVTVTRKGDVLPAPEAARNMREILARLLSVSTGSMPGLAATARPRKESDQGIDAFVAELEAALVPVNRSAGRRVLARLARETARARQAGRLRIRAPEPAAPPLPVVVAPVVPPPAATPTVGMEILQSTELSPPAAHADAKVVEDGFAPDAWDPFGESSPISTDVDAPAELVADESGMRTPAGSGESECGQPVLEVAIHTPAFREIHAVELREPTPTEPELPDAVEDDPAPTDPELYLAQQPVAELEPDIPFEEFLDDLVSYDIAPVLERITTPAAQIVVADSVIAAEPPLDLTPAGPVPHLSPVESFAHSIAHLTPTGTTLPWPVGLAMQPLPARESTPSPAAVVERILEPMGAGVSDCEPIVELVAEPDPSSATLDIFALSADPEPSVPALDIFELNADPEPSVATEPPPAPAECAAPPGDAPIAPSRVDELLARFGASSSTDLQATAASLKLFAGLDLTPPPIGVDTASGGDSLTVSRRSASAAPVLLACASPEKSPVPKRIAGALKVSFAFLMAAVAGAVIFWQIQSALSAPGMKPPAPSTTAGSPPDKALSGTSEAQGCPAGSPCPVLAGTP